MEVGSVAALEAVVAHETLFLKGPKPTALRLWMCCRLGSVEDCNAVSRTPPVQKSRLRW
jgi:hypothetical protein